MAGAVHAQLGPLSCAIPVEVIARALDITEIRKEVLDGCEGTLITDRLRSSGMILVNSRGGARRAGFSIAHGLGHFLLEYHVLSDARGFVCDRQDMQESREKTRHPKQEREANSFAIELLAPGYRLKPYLSGEPDLRSAVQMGRELEISREAAVRRYVERHDEPLAAIMTKNGAVRYSVRQDAFPWIKLKTGDRISGLTHARRVISAGNSDVSRFAESHAAAWIDKTEIEIFEQTRLGRDGFAITLLWASVPEEDADDGGPEELNVPRFHKRPRR